MNNKTSKIKTTKTKTTKTKTPKQLERYFKGMANHWRIAILFTAQKYPGITVDGITGKLDGDFKNISQHTHRLVSAGLLNKKHQGSQVSHFLSPYGKLFFEFVEKFAKNIL